VSFIPISSVPQSSLSDLCWSINRIMIHVAKVYTSLSSFSLTKMFRRTSSCDNCFVLHSDIHSVHNFCTHNHMKFNTAETELISFSRITNMLT
jgi:hypothetical protein